MGKIFFHEPVKIESVTPSEMLKIATNPATFNKQLVIDACAKIEDELSWPTNPG